MSTMSATVHRGHIIHLQGNPSLDGAKDALVEFSDGGLVVDGKGRIVAVGAFDTLTIPDGALIEVHRDSYILPGFIDAHAHFPQVYCQDLYGGGQLLEWLETCIFPSEARLSDKSLARAAARDFIDAQVRAGTTTALIFGSQYPSAQEALFSAARAAGLRIIAGRTTMVLGPASASALLTSEAEALSLIRDEIRTFHAGPGDPDCGMRSVAIIPRFALSVTPNLLKQLGDLLEEARDAGVCFTSHLSENDRSGDGEIEQVLRTYRVGRYLDVYDGLFLPGSKRGGKSLLGPRSVLAHAVHCSPDEYRRLAETRTAVAHCPTSQLFLGSGTMPWKRVTGHQVALAAGTDVGAGDTFSIPEVLNCTFKVHANAGSEAHQIHPAELLHLGTLGGAQALGLADRIGNFDPGKEADFVVACPDEDPLLAERLDREAARGLEARLFTLLLSLRQKTIKASYVRGRRLSQVASRW